MTREFELIIFDWDGTLMDSVQRISSCVQASFSNLGMAPPMKEEIKNQIGKSLDQFMEALIGTDKGELVKELCNEYRTTWLSGILPESRPFEGVRNLLRNLRIEGYKLAVATGKSRRGLDREFTKMGFKHFFQTSRCADESGSKPDPAMLNWICEQQGIPKVKALMVGDTTHDLEMAYRAEVPSVGVLCGCHSTEELQRWEPVTLLEKTYELGSWLKKHS